MIKIHLTKSEIKQVNNKIESVLKFASNRFSPSNIHDSQNLHYLQHNAIITEKQKQLIFETVNIDLVMDQIITLV